MAPQKALQVAKHNPSCLLLPQKSRQLAFAADAQRYAA